MVKHHLTNQLDGRNPSKVVIRMLQRKKNKSAIWSYYSEFANETNIPAQDPNVSSPIQHKVQIFTTKVDRNLTDLRTKMQQDELENMPTFEKRNCCNFPGMISHTDSVH